MATTIERAAKLYETSETANDAAALQYAHNITNGSISTPHMRHVLARYDTMHERVNDEKPRADTIARNLRAQGYTVKRTRTSFGALGYGTLYTITGIRRKA